MTELRYLMAPGKKKIVGVLESMRVYREVDRVSITETGTLKIPYDYQQTRLHAINSISIFIDEDGKHWFARDLWYVPEPNKPESQAFRPADDGILYS